MSSLIAPIEITKKGLLRTDNEKESIDSFLNLLLNTTCGECYIDPHFGFIFNNLRFEIFNEQQGVIYNSNPDENVAEEPLHT